MSLSELRKHARDETAPTFDLLVARFILKAVENADHHRFALIIDRLTKTANSKQKPSELEEEDIERRRKAMQTILADPELRGPATKIARLLYGSDNQEGSTSDRELDMVRTSR
ncbi:MAG: hypothetical protein V1495_03410 [Pseudomonadota bacterium]